MTDAAEGAAAGADRAAPGAGSGLRLVLGAAVAANAVLLLLLIGLAVLVDRQADLLAARSELHGFDPSVFPPFSGAIQALANGAAVLTGLVLVALLALCAGLRRGRAAVRSSRGSVSRRAGGARR